MATFRCKPAPLFVLVFSLACISRDGAPAAAEDRIQKIPIAHVTPRPDFVGTLPAVLEWTAAAGVDSYAVQVENDIEIPVFEQDGIAATSTPWPAGLRVEPGTYYWRVAGLRAGRVVADSGRAAFVVREP